VRKGIEEGVYVYKRGDLLAGPGDPIPTIKIDEETMIFTMEFAKNKGIWPRPAPAPAAQLAAVGGGAAVVTGPTPTGGGDFPPVGPSPATGAGERPQAQIAGAKVFTAEGVLKEALRRVIEQAKTAKLDKVDRIVIRLFEYGDAFKLVPIANTVAGAKRGVRLEGSFMTAQDSEFEFEFNGTAQDASTMKDYLEPQFRAAKETDLKASISFDFDAGLALDGDAADKFVEKLTRFASAAAYVEATAEVK